MRDKLLLTKEQKIILTGYTGILMCENFSDFHDDVERRLGRPILTHEFAFNNEMIKELYKEDFLYLCGVK